MLVRWGPQPCSDPPMNPKYLVNIGSDRLFFTADREPTERESDADIRDPEIALPIWPAEQESATSDQWNQALARYSLTERRDAKVRVLGAEEAPIAVAGTLPESG